MDVVRVSTAGAVSALAVLALVSTARQGRAEAPTPRAQISEPNSGSAGSAGASPSLPVRVSPFSLSGPTMPAPATPVPTIYGASLYPLPRFSGAPRSPWDALIDEAARRFAIPPSWVRGVMQIESGGHTTLNGRPITSTAGAMGLMQVMPATFTAMAQRYGLGGDPYDPRANILAGAAFLREMYDRYGAAHFLAAYNAGPGRVDEHLRYGRPLPFETRRYVQTLAPRFLAGQYASATGAPPQVQGLTSATAMRRVASPAYRPRSTALRSPERAPLFVAANDLLSTGDRQQEAQLNDTLFVRLTHQDQRTREARDDSAEN